MLLHISNYYSYNILRFKALKWIYDVIVLLIAYLKNVFMLIRIYVLFFLLISADNNCITLSNRKAIPLIILNNTFCSLFCARLVFS